MAHAGFDCSGFPGVSTMAWLKKNTNLEWCGFYLGPAPSHRAVDWMEQRATLMGLGWGLAPIFVGQQTVGPGSHSVDASHGAMEADVAAELMHEAGFAQGAVVFLDLENGGPMPVSESGYVKAWVEGVAKGGFTPGVYVSHVLVGAVRAVAPAARIWTFRVPTVATTIFKGIEFPAPAPDQGAEGASLWQYRQNVQIQSPALRILVDLDSADSKNPSAP